MGIAGDIMGFFYVLNGNRIAENKIQPKTIGDFSREYKLSNEVLREYHLNDVFHTCQALKRKGFLWQAGVTFDMSPSPKEAFYSYVFSEDEAVYGTYEFIAFGFPKIREHFSSSVIAIEVIDKNDNPDIGSAFFHNTGTVFTCRHCIDKMKQVSLIGFPKTNRLERILVPKDERLDLAMLVFESDVDPNPPRFNLQQYQLLDNVMTMGFPPIPGFESILVTETAQIAGHLKSSTGQIVSQTVSYLDNQEYLLITARVKGGNSGGPVVSEQGKVVGIVSRLPSDGESRADLLGYAATIPSHTVGKFLAECDALTDNVQELDFKITAKGFTTLL